MTLSAKSKGLLPRDRWRRSALAFAAAAFLAFSLNLSFILWATVNTTIRDGIGTISDRSCASIKAWNSSIHVVINIISTTLFSGSNYCMQRLMAPTRSEIDRAHAEKRWLDVGVPSVRNLWRMPVGRKLLWLLLFILALYGCIGLLVYGLKAMDSNQEVPMWKLGLGVVRGSTILNTSFIGRGSQNLLHNVILANTPQVVMTAIYYLYNSLFTSISIATEWDRFGSDCKGLRVSSKPRQDQRETYFLQLPYRYSLPLAAFSAFMHWLISQSLFLVSLELWTTTMSPELSTVANGEGLISCGWSPIGVMCVIVASLLLLAFLLVVGGRRLWFGVMPVASSCSAAIAAACHPFEAKNTDEADAWTKPVRWGVVSAPDASPGHCSFSSGPVKDPVLGRMYA
ncbi:hypothetical protein CPLU01_11341 [Colletotrichum plurivorum]|uniref:DUF6536 domain-containing protein n=1 Tax=Colletotrichum plurivorum TaxID=2175906 RepID=A0A8H6N8G4_9PEZI|nr:hypothetical protein CPLU01_11341 [Colletotrichum plurivorum]